MLNLKDSPAEQQRAWPVLEQPAQAWLSVQPVLPWLQVLKALHWQMPASLSQSPLPASVLALALVSGPAALRWAGRLLAYHRFAALHYLRHLMACCQSAALRCLCQLLACRRSAALPAVLFVKACSPASARRWLQRWRPAGRTALAGCLWAVQTVQACYLWAARRCWWDVQTVPACRLWAVRRCWWACRLSQRHCWELMDVWSGQKLPVRKLLVLWWTQVLQPWAWAVAA